MPQVRRKVTWLVLALVLGLQWTLVCSPAAPQPGAGPLLEKPQPTSELPGPEEKQGEAPTICGPLISDRCLPIEEHHFSMQVLWALSLVTGNFNQNWRRESAGGNFYTFQMPVKFTRI